MMREMSAETDRLFRESRAETERMMRESRAETDRKFRESGAETERIIRESNAETRHLFQESDRKFHEMSAETDRLFRESRAETERMMRESRAETDRLFQESRAETDRRFQETERFVKTVSEQIGNLGGKWGRFVENMVAPACETLFVERGFFVHRVFQRVRNVQRPDGQNMEIDILVEDTNEVMLVEVKSTLTVRDVREHLRSLRQFKEFFPRYADCRVMGAVAGIVVEENATAFALRYGLFVIRQSGEMVQLANPREFEPRFW
ncbi:MAG: DUF3782 domain-containing protein [Magnetococcales bacterium]|nr:DUF3782 domain-containing protein [Magnetococcales bacterium]